MLTVADDGTDEHGVTAPCELSHECDVSFPAWTPDGRLVVTVADDRERPDVSQDPMREVSRLELLDLEHRARRTVVRRDHRTGRQTRRAVSPDGRVVLYTRSNT